MAIKRLPWDESTPKKALTSSVYMLAKRFTQALTQLTLLLAAKSPNLCAEYTPVFINKGKEKIIVATQLESHHAREVFPCIDEPEAKSSFDVIYTGPKDQTVLSNMPAKSTKTNGNKVTTAFETTPIMSVYLLAFVAGELHAVETKSKAGVAVRS